MDLEPVMLSRKRSWNSSVESLCAPHFDGRSASPLKKLRHVGSSAHTPSFTPSPLPPSTPYLSTPGEDALRASQMTPPPVDYSPGYPFPQACHMTQASPPDALMTDACGQSTQMQVEFPPPSPESDVGHGDDRPRILQQMEEHYQQQQQQQQQQEAYQFYMRQQQNQARVLDIRGGQPGQEMGGSPLGGHGTQTQQATGGHRRFRMGFLPGCQQCMMRVPGHYSHI